MLLHLKVRTEIEDMIGEKFKALNIQTLWHEKAHNSHLQAFSLRKLEIGISG